MKTMPVHFASDGVGLAAVLADMLPPYPSTVKSEPRIREARHGTNRLTATSKLARREGTPPTTRCPPGYAKLSPGWSGYRCAVTKSENRDGLASRRQRVYRNETFRAVVTPNNVARGVS